MRKKLAAACAALMIAVTVMGCAGKTPAASEDSNENEASVQEEEPEEEENTGTASAETNGTVTVLENVRIRSSASENGEKLGTAYTGEKLELIMKQADGWTKIKYNGKTAYVKSDYVE